MQQIILKYPKSPFINTIQRNYPLDVNYFKHDQNFSRTFLTHCHSSNNDSFILAYLRTWVVWRK